MLQQNKIDQALQNHFKTSLTTAEKGSWQHSTKEAGNAILAVRKAANKPSSTPKKIAMSTTTTTTIHSGLSTDYFCKQVTAMVNDSSFREGHAKNKAPLAMLAFAGVALTGAACLPGCRLVSGSGARPLHVEQVELAERSPR